MYVHTLYISNNYITVVVYEWPSICYVSHTFRARDERECARVSWRCIRCMVIHFILSTNWPNETVRFKMKMLFIVH